MVAFQVVKADVQPLTLEATAGVVCLQVEIHWKVVVARVAVEDVP